ncbi:BnaC02g24060D [Brassica napus]|uniref:BnaC02g24060D protein n=1 Tax=Brassica napus TaxID=3708 RepID=A0A078G1H7_BRANA|nr:BnaC02g24060D [Brassica napus]
MESQTQTLVALVWGGSKMCLRKKDGSLFHIRRSRITGLSLLIFSHYVSGSLLCVYWGADSDPCSCMLI